MEAGVFHDVLQSFFYISKSVMNFIFLFIHYVVTSYMWLVFDLSLLLVFRNSSTLHPLQNFTCQLIQKSFGKLASERFSTSYISLCQILHSQFAHEQYLSNIHSSFFKLLPSVIIKDVKLCHDQRLNESFPKQLALFIFSKCIQNRFARMIVLQM